ncbi:uncharacterized protein LOC123015690 [Tribolium madens]|uniref:uncharacterized protein LOC123015690 n=1 Tax=Tribolium madens TaxID=41895 RepID=UPI001CF751C4|nr:uncharacterized protein LOC123015690 [Tribolium madens]
MRLRVLVCMFLILLIVSPSSENIFDSFIATNEMERARKKKKGGGNSKYTVPLLFGALMIKSIIFPLAFKAMAVMSSIAILLSTMSLIMSSIVGYIKMGFKSAPVKVVHKQPSFNSWAKDDDGKNYYADNYDLVAPPPQ